MRGVISFTVPGVPVPKGRPRLGKGHVYTPARTKAYEAKVRGLALIARQKARQRVWTGPVWMEVTFYVKNIEARPDLSNLLKSVEDACNGVLYEDDSQIVFVRANKATGTPETFVKAGIYREHR